ncbi:MAG: hypothetical protein M3P34_04410 [Actinomycetota bacterium]|nr:hypothetical protein [Actinomycetota bacterium]
MLAEEREQFVVAGGNTYYRAAMGLFARFTHSTGQWREAEPADEPYLSIDVHDSDIATVDYRPAPPGLGRFYLGVEPRIYFEDPTASDTVDREAEAKGFSQWARDVHGRDVDPADVLALMAADSDEDDDEPEDAFVEDTVDRLLGLVGLPLPEGMPSDDDD